MTKRDAFEIACRVLALYVAVLAIGAFGEIARWYVTLREMLWDVEPAILGQLSLWATPAGYSLFAVWLWFVSPALAQRLEGNAGSPEPGPDASRSLEGVAFRTLGLFLLATGVVGIAAFVAQSLARSSSLETMEEFLRAYPELPSNIAQFMVGMFLLFGWTYIGRAGRPLAGFWEAPQEGPDETAR